MPEYLWLVIVGAFAAFLFGFGTGANDVGNAFGTSVGSKTLTLRQATVVSSWHIAPVSLLEPCPVCPAPTHSPISACRSPPSSRALVVSCWAVL
jgi:hypothetical protein